MREWSDEGTCGGEAARRKGERWGVEEAPDFLSVFQCCLFLVLLILVRLFSPSACLAAYPALVTFIVFQLS